MTAATRTLSAAADAILKADAIATRARKVAAPVSILKADVAPVDAFALKPVPRAPKAIAPVSLMKVTKPTRVKAGVIASTPAVDAAPADTFTTASIAREYGKSPKTIRAFVRRHIEALKPLMTAQHVYPNAHRAQVVALLKLA